MTMILSVDAQRLWDAARTLNASHLTPSPGPPPAPHLDPHRPNVIAAPTPAPTGAFMTKRPALPPLLFFTDPARTPRPWETAGRLPSGAAVIYRHFGAADAGDVAQRLRDVTAKAGVLLLIGQDAELAERVSADGVHLAERSLSEATVLARRHPDWLLTGAAHSLETVVSASDQLTDSLSALVVSPVFTAGGASAARPALGIDPFTDMVGASALPVYGLGGITADNADRLLESGACGIAGVDSIQRAFA